MDKMVTPAAFIRATAGLRWDDTNVNCAFWVADYIAAKTGVDPAAAHRGKFTRAFEYRQFLVECGGLLALSRKMLDAPSEQVENGVAVVRIHKRVLAAIISNGRVWIKTNGGVVSPPDCEILERWAI